MRISGLSMHTYELIVVVHTHGAYSLFGTRCLGAKFRMAMAGILILRGDIAPSVQHTVEHIPTFASGAGSGGLIDAERLKSG